MSRSLVLLHSGVSWVWGLHIRLVGSLLIHTKNILYIHLHIGIRPQSVVSSFRFEDSVFYQ